MILKAAIVGMGKMGRIRKKVLDAHVGFEVIAICDQDEDLQKEFPDLLFDGMDFFQITILQNTS